MNKSVRFRQQGVALITVLLVVSIATILAVSMATRQQLDINIVSKRLGQIQSNQYALGAEALARQLLYIDYQNDKEQGEQAVGDNPTDNLAESWAQKQPPFEIDQGVGVIELQINDLQGKFNINNLITRASTNNPNQAPPPPDLGAEPSENQPNLPGGGSGVQQSPELKQFKSLLRSVGVDEALADGVREWINGEQGSLRDSDYLVLEPPYRAYHGAMVSVSELRLILFNNRRLTNAEYRRILPFVCALPVNNTKININTASAPVLSSLSEQLPDSKASSIVEQRGEQGFADLAEFRELAGANVQTNNIGLTSNYFQVDIRVRFADRTSYLQSIIKRENNGVLKVINRDYGQRFTSEFFTN